MKSKAADSNSFPLLLEQQDKKMAYRRWRYARVGVLEKIIDSVYNMPKALGRAIERVGQ